ncbi:peptidylprolyl isomerase [Altererythrobacter arenosus]|uniref:peptidylprolyl isomerase n=1 Tax=Altererythrobacter arenosus TaxID=3032592 RepID=A0ABY8FVP8_9SPHN|nr:esterase-like activity of phytase family protein [Altererythrobacter sp. CAU 1644]WFL77241.1 peptidylprolyl isomerase [Altererythrobacter sp. CAU 1644]
MPQTLTVALDPAAPENLKLGELTYRGGLEIEPGEEDIGGISGLEWWDGKLYAVSDDGRWLIMTPGAFRDKLVDLIEIEVGPLLDERGKKLRRKEDADAEALTRSSSGDWFVSFEHNHRVWRYPGFGESALPGDLAVEGLVDGAASNNGIESLSITPDGWLACTERTGGTKPNCLRQSSSGLESIDIATPAPLDDRGGVPTDADCASNGVCYVLFRSHSSELGNGAAIVAIGPDGNRETLASWDSALSIDNFEGLAVREEGPRTYLYIISDNNFSDGQRTLLLKFEVSARAASAPGIPEKVFATTRVILETSMGEITVALETERAPITASNFLRYIDEDRYDGTKCYRARHVAGGEQPAGFLQCGTQNHPDRILDPIAHEPTNETGLNHTDGALSMARFDPGTATGDFSIMIRDQPGLDAQPDAEDPAQRPGFAVFGYVVEGMDVVHAIHATRIDPDKGEGFLKGQMLAEPVTIVNVRRAEPE